ncbi:TetR/AcrR family transcriptional regulator [Streptomyces sp. NPDC021080]|uniref:TetR/AcrR family transcriptional regulator n=1 Tax=Streptomyces sp. NPDC021080 TaxID=3365110 RepID=UPI0037A670B3
MKDESSTSRRRHSAGEATRVLLLEAAEQLFATRGIDGVSLREIQVAAGQSNSSVIGYHFGSKSGLVRALIAYRQPALDDERDAGIAQLKRAIADRDPQRATARELVALVVGPLASSIRRGEMYTPFLARLSEDPKARSEYWPSDIEDHVSSEVTEELVDAVLQALPERIRRARAHQFFVSVLHALGDHARQGTSLSDMRLSAYIDGWSAMLTARVSPETESLIDS